MNRQELRELMMPLSSRELLYRDHPEMAGDYFGLKPGTSNDTSLDSDALAQIDALTLAFSGLPRQASTSSHGAIIIGQAGGLQHESIAFNRQTRFSRVPPHRHNYLELTYVYAGECTTTIDGHAMHLNAGDVCIMDTQTIHCIDVLGENDIVLNAIMTLEYFDAQFISRLAASGPVAQFLAEALSKMTVSSRHLLFHTKHRPFIRELFEDVLCEYLDPGACSKDVIDSYMTLIFINLARCYQTSKEEEARIASKSYLTQVLRYIEQNYATCTLEETAARFNYHPNYLSRIIKQATGLSYRDLVNQMRLNQALFLLGNTNLAISEVGERCGWSNRQQFYSKFKQMKGCTPREYREQVCDK